MTTYTIVCPSFEEAVNKARAEYGDRVRIIRRRDYHTPGLLPALRRPRCEILVFVPEPEKQTDPVPSTASVDPELSSRGTTVQEEDISGYSQYFYENDRQKDQLETERLAAEKNSRRSESLKVLEPFLQKAKKIMVLNDFSDAYTERLMGEVRRQLTGGLPDLPKEQDFEILLLDNIVSSFESDHSTQLYPPGYFVLTGLSGSGKTAAAAKIGNLFSSNLGKNVEVVSVVDEPEVPVQAHAAQIDANGVYHSVRGYAEFPITDSKRDIFILDCFSPEQKDENGLAHLTQCFQKLPRDDTKFFLVLDASMQDRDLVRNYSVFRRIAFQSLVLTKCDESETIGNVISVCSQYGLPLLFITDGNNLLSNIHFASSFAVLSRLKGFSLDMNMLVQGN